MNYKVGDLAKITGNCNRHWFKIGETVRLKEYLGGMNHAWKAEYLDGRDWWYVCESDMKPYKPTIMPQKIVITTDGKTTLARLFDGKTMVKRAEAKCAPSDTFNFNTGANLAFNRLVYGTDYNPQDVAVKAKPAPTKSKPEPVKLYCVESWMPGSWITKGKIYEIKSNGRIRFDDGYFPTWKSLAKPSMQTKSLFPLVRRPAKVGEWVYVKHAYDWQERNFGIKPGKIYKVHEVLQSRNESGNECDVRLEVNGEKSSVCVNTEENYLVLDGYKGDAE